jgi:hypothetical protein
MLEQPENDFSGRIFRILQAPVLGRVLGINKQESQVPCLG